MQRHHTVPACLLAETLLKGAVLLQWSFHTFLEIMVCFRFWIAYCNVLLGDCPSLIATPGLVKGLFCPVLYVPGHFNFEQNYLQ